MLGLNGTWLRQLVVPTATDARGSVAVATACGGMCRDTAAGLFATCSRIETV